MHTDKRFYGWVPILSGELIIDGILFRDADINDFKKLFSQESDKILLSDRIFDRLFKIKHIVSYEKIDLGSCEECGEKVLYLSVKVSNRKGEKLVEGDVWIHGSGLTKYEVKYICPEHPAPERILHRLVRDVFHTHVHHSSDLPLPPIESKNEYEAKKKILVVYVRKFIEYKKKVSKMRIEEAIEDYSRARGEIVYANALYELCRNTSVDGSYFLRSFKSFDESFKILIGRLSDRLHLATNYIIISLTSLIIALSFLQLSLYFPQGVITIGAIKLWYITLKPLNLHVFRLFSLLALLFFLKFFIESIRIKQK